MKLLPLIMLVLAVVSLYASKRRSKHPEHKHIPSPEVHAQVTPPTVAQNAAPSRDNLADSDLETLLNALKDPDYDVRDATRKALEAQGAAAVPGLPGCLQDSDLNVREQAAQALGQIGEKSAVPGLIDALNDYSSWVRAPAAEALGMIGAAAAVPALVKALNDDDKDVRRAAAEALKRIGTAEAREVLARLTG